MLWICPQCFIVTFSRSLFLPLAAVRHSSRCGHCFAARGASGDWYLLARFVCLFRTASRRESGNKRGPCLFPQTAPVTSGLSGQKHYLNRWSLHQGGEYEGGAGALFKGTFSSLFFLFLKKKKNVFWSIKKGLFFFSTMIKIVGWRVNPLQHRGKEPLVSTPPPPPPPPNQKGFVWS